MEAACRRILPWHLKILEHAGKQGVVTFGQRGAYNKHNSAPFVNQAAPWIWDAVNTKAKGLSASAAAGQLSVPADEQIAYALEALFVQQWRELIPKLQRRDLKPLRSYLANNKGNVENYEIVEAHIRNRTMILALRQPGARWINISNPLWALRQRLLFQALNRELTANGSRQSSVDELASARAIARRLDSQFGDRVYGKKVTTWLERFEREPFESFDGSRDDYLLNITDPRAYRKLRRLREQRKEE